MTRKPRFQDLVTWVLYMQSTPISSLAVTITNLQLSAPGVQSIGSEYVCFYVKLKQICADLRNGDQF